MPRPYFVLSLVFACVGTLTAVLAAEDWPRFRGENGLGVSTSESLPSEIGPGANVIWEVAAEQGSSSPVIVQGKLYLASFNGDVRSVQCLDAATGKELWKQSVPKVRDENSSLLNGPATCSPAADGKHVVAFFPDTALLCYSDGGELRWRVDVGPFHSMHGIANSPVIANDKVLLLADQLQGSYLAAYELATGRPVWKVDRANGLTGGYSTPAIFQQDGRATLVLTSGPGGLNAYDLDTGQAVFSVPGIANAPVTLPVVSASRVFLCEPVGEAMPISSMLPPFDKDQDGKLSLEEVKGSVPMLRMLERMDKEWGNGDEVVESSEWDAAFKSFIDNGGLVAVDMAARNGSSTASVTWNYRKAVPYIASPVSYQGLLYLVDDQGIVTVIDAQDGEVVKKGRLKKGVKFYASPIAADGKIFIVDTSGRFTVLKAGADWEELSSTEFGEQCFATPAICDGRIYLRTKSKLYCFGQQK